MGYLCTHKGVAPVMPIGKARIWAGKEFDVKPEFNRFRLVLSALGMPVRPKAPLTVTQVAKRLLPGVMAMKRKPVPGFLAFDWPDGGVPRCGREFWDRLVEDIGKIEGDVVAYCMGGHGRTGTILACLAAVSGAAGKEDPVLWVRRRYCESAVETRSQIAYLNKIGITTTAIPSYEIRDAKQDVSFLAKPDRDGLGQRISDTTSTIEAGFTDAERRGYGHDRFY